MVFSFVLFVVRRGDKLTDTNEYAFSGIWFDRDKVGFDDFQNVAVDGENESGVDRSVDKSEKIADSLTSRKYVL